MSTKTTPLGLCDAVRNYPLFEGLTASDLGEITDLMDIVPATKGKLIMGHGDATRDVYFLVSGSVIGQLVAANGKEILFTEIGEGGHFGELSALDGATRSISISATSDCELAVLSSTRFIEILKKHPQVAINLSKELSCRLRAMNERVFGLVVHDVETRVRTRLLQLAQAQEQLMEGGVISDLPTHEAMAGYVGSNREAVSRSMAKMVKAGVIKTDRKKVRINDLGALLASAE